VSGESALAISGLSKKFSGLQAVDRLSLEVKRGEIYGFLGPNGAGKTTTIKMILGLVHPDAGQVLIDGRDLAAEPHEIKRRLGYLPERVAFYNNLTALQTLQFFAKLKGQPTDGLAGLLESVGLKEFIDKRLGTFSKGMVQLVGLAQALIGNPSFLLLDEPTTGLDPNWSRFVKDKILEVNKQGTTVFFSSHILPEVEQLANRVAILNRGQLVAQDTVDKLRVGLNVKPRLRLSIGPPVAEAARLVQAVPGVTQVVIDGWDLVLECAPDARARAVTTLVMSGVPVGDLRTYEPSLEEVFMHFTQDSRGAVR
jgi:ABC-type multidrug transport system ATPase subunit